jgi:hypothetical protein
METNEEKGNGKIKIEFQGKFVNFKRSGRIKEFHDDDSDPVYEGY